MNLKVHVIDATNLQRFLDIWKDKVKFVIPCYNADPLKLTCVVDET